MELGSEYNLSLQELNVREDNIFGYLSGYEKVLWFDSGRSALKHIALHLRQEDEILLPEFICESVSDCFPPEKTAYYRLQPDFTVNVDDLKTKISDKTRLLFVMHYFGAVQPQTLLEEIRTLARQHNCVIVEDTTHSLFSRKSTVGDYTDWSAIWRLFCTLTVWQPVRAERRRFTFR